MSTTIDTTPPQAADRRLDWTPPPRPDWVQKINEEGYCMDIGGVVPLDEASLIDAAMRATGLSDFGTDEWREPFRILVRSMEEEADLNLMGRLRTRSELLLALQARLQVEDTYKRHPEIEDEVIEKPIIIIGQGRSGTSFLVNVLARNPDHGAIRHWEAMFPCPPPEKATYDSDPRIEKAHRLIDQWNRVTPTITSMHEFAGIEPMEDCQVIGLSFMAPSWYDSLGQIPSYDAAMAKLDPMPALLYHRRVLKLLQWKNPRRNWVLKDPLHLDRLPALLKLYPDACFVWPHRDPVRALASTVSLLGTIQWGRCDHPFSNGSFEYVLNPDLAAARFEQVIDLLESGAVPRERLLNIQYRDLVGDTMKTLESIYRYFDIPLTPEGRAGMERYLREHPREARPPHALQAASEDAVARERRAFAR